MGRDYIMTLELLVYILIFTSCIYLSHSSIVIAGKCSEGVVICCDSQFSQGGRIVSSREASRLYKLTDDIAICYVSGAAKHFCSLCQDLDELILTDRYNNIPIRHQHSEAIAHYTRRLAYDRYPSVHAVLVGINKKASNNNNNNNNNGHVDELEIVEEAKFQNKVDKYNIYEILPRGTLIKQDLVIAGTGAESVLGLLESRIQSQSQAEDEAQSQAQLSNKSNENQIKDMNDMNVNLNSNSNESDTSTTSGTTLSLTNEDAIQDLRLEDLEKMLRSAVETAIRIDPRSGGSPKLYTFKN